MRPVHHSVMVWAASFAMLVGTVAWAGPDNASSLALEPAHVRKLASAAREEQISGLLHDIEGFGSRAIGQPGLTRAGDWLAGRLTTMGFRVLGWQIVPVDVPMDKGSRIRWSPGRSARVHSLWPNLVVPPVLPEGGLTAIVIVAGKGRLEEFDGQEVRGAIVLMEYESQDRWMNAAALGAGAVIFLPATGAPVMENLSKYCNVPMQFPRFYLEDEAAAAELRALAAAGGKATLTGGMSWVRAESRNLVAWLPADAPVPRPETILINLPYDAESVIPSAAAGGRSAGNIAAALAALEALASVPRSHHLLVCLDGARSMNGVGTRAFTAVMRDIHAARAAESSGIGAGSASEEDLRAGRLRRQMDGVEPWMDARRRLLKVKVDRLKAAIAWLKQAGNPVKDFGFRDAVVLPRSPWLQHADAGTWLTEDLRDQVKGRQIATLMSLRECERENGVDAYLPDAQTQEPVLSWRRKAAYYRVVAAEKTPEEILRAMHSVDTEGIQWEADDATPDRLATGYGTDLAEIERDLRVLEQDIALREALVPFEVTRHIAIDISAGSSILTLHRAPFLGGDARSGQRAQMEWSWSLGPAASQAAEAVVQQANRLIGAEAQSFDFSDSVTFNASRTRQVGASEDVSDVCADAAMAGFSPCRLCTANDPRVQRMGPGDRIPSSRTELRNLQTQSRTLALLLAELLRKPSLLPVAEHLRSRVVSVGGRTVVRDPRAGPFPRLPVPGMIVSLGGDRAASLPLFALSNRKGEFRFDSLSGLKVPETGELALSAFRVNLNNGMLEYALDMGASSLSGGSTSVGNQRGEIYRRLVCFQGSAMQFYGLTDPMLLTPPKKAKLLAGKGGSLDNWYLSEPDARTLVALVPPESSVKLLTSVAGYGNRMFLLGDQTSDFAGIGYNVGRGTNLVGTVQMAARDLVTLNSARIDKLTRKGVRSGVATRLHRQAGERLKAMNAAVAAKRWSEAHYLAREAWGRALRAYPRIMEMSNQAVLAAVLLLAFLAVAAVFLERIVLQSGSVYGRIGGALAIFSAGVALLYALHPAFQISTTPMIIIVAYVIEVLALLACGVVSGKYAEVMKVWREKVGGIHASDISRAGALAVAFNLGLTNLAKRPLRTTLTIVTVALLAFSVMTFTSVESSLDTRFVPLSAESSSDGDSLLFRLYKWAPIAGTMAESFEQDLGAGSMCVRRSLKVNAREPWDIGLGANRFMISRFIEPPPGPRSSATGVSTRRVEKTFIAEALPGYMAEETRFSRLHECVVGRWFSGRADEVILPTAAAAALGVKEADVAGADEARQVRIHYGNAVLRVVGILDTARADRVRDGSAAPLAPVDFYASGLTTAVTDTDLRNAVGSEAGVRFVSFDQVVLLPYQLAIDLGGDIYSIAGRLAGTSGGRVALEDLMSRIEVNLYASIDGHSYLVKTARSQSVQGAWKLLMPILLVILIMVNVMYGTVDERCDEIMMLGAVGLAPRHVSILFLAEACVYGVLGVVFGVLLGLGVGWTTRGTASTLDVNYASVSTMVMGMMVMGVVVLATWIPAARAARLATPSGAAKWQLPTSAEGRLSLALPFHLTRENGLGVFAFLHEYLDGHRESTSPEFRCTSLKTGIVPDGEQSTAAELAGLVWPAPYDRRVSQQVSFKMTAVEGTELFRVTVSCERLSGELDAWNSGVFEFLDAIRRQFLVFRTLSDEHKLRYVAAARDLLA